MVKLSSTVTVPPAESIVRFPELVSISLSAVIPTCTFPAVFPVEVTLLENVPVVPATAPEKVPVVPETAPAANVPPHVRFPLPSVINAWFAVPSSLGNVKVTSAASDAGDLTAME